MHTKVEVEEISETEGRHMLNNLARTTLGISRESFLANLDAGVYGGMMEDERILNLVMLAPFGR